MGREAGKNNYRRWTERDKYLCVPRHGGSGWFLVEGGWKWRICYLKSFYSHWKLCLPSRWIPSAQLFSVFPVNIWLYLNYWLCFQTSDSGSKKDSLFMTTCAFPSGTKGLVCLSHLRAQRFCVIILHIQRFFTIAGETELWVYVPILCWKQQLGHNLTMSKKGLLTHNFLEDHCHKKGLCCTVQL